MATERLREKLGIDEELIKLSCKLSQSFSSTNDKLFCVDRSSSENAAFFVFSSSSTVNEWFSDEAFGAKIIKKVERETRGTPDPKPKPPEWSEEAFPSLRSVGNDVYGAVNKAFLDRFEKISKDHQFLEEIKTTLEGKKQIIFTGHSAGGAIAALATIWFFEHYYKEDFKDPKCLTFGSPLIGDEIVSHALRRENWSRHFLHFVIKHDIVPRIMLAPLSSIKKEFEDILGYFTSQRFPERKIAANFYTNVMTNASSVTSKAASKLMGNTDPLLDTVSNFIKLSPYRPFGTYVFCTEKGKLVHFDNSQAILQVLFYSCLMKDESEMEAIAASCIKSHLSYESKFGARGSSDMGAVFCVDQLAGVHLASDGTPLDDLCLSTRGRLCLRAAGELENRKQRNQEKMKQKLEEMEDGMKGLQEYKIFYQSKEGYYDAFKKQDEKRDFDANVRRLVLAGIWDEIIEMLKVYNLPDEFEADEYWIDQGTKLRHLVEPLDVANYYRHARDQNSGAYMKVGRPRRYRYPQKWLEKKNKLEKDSCGDSCFWAEMEELINLFSNGPTEIEKRAKKLQEDLAKWINDEDNALGKDALQGQTFAELWKKLRDMKLQQECIRPFLNIK